MSGKHGGKLEGNATRKLLKCTSSLEVELKKLPTEKYEKAHPYIVARILTVWYTLALEMRELRVGRVA